MLAKYCVDWFIFYQIYSLLIEIFYLKLSLASFNYWLCISVPCFECPTRAKPREYLGIPFTNVQGPNLETKIALQKKTSVERKITCRRLKNVLGFAKRFSEFAKGIYEICDRNLFNLAIIIVAVFSIVQFILCLRFAINN